MVFGIGRRNREEDVSEMPPPGGPTLGPPTDLVLGMRQQGFTNNQIVQALQRDGYSADQIFDAMSQADIKTSTAPLEPADFPAEAAPSEMPSGGFERERVEELTEAIIEEKWSDLTTNINRVIEWKNRSEAKIDALEQKMNQLQNSFDELHNAIVGKIGDYDKHIREIGTDIRAMETVFKKALPTFTQNVNELSRMIKKTKKSA